MTALFLKLFQFVFSLFFRTFAQKGMMDATAAVFSSDSFSSLPCSSFPCRRPSLRRVWQRIQLLLRSLANILMEFCCSRPPSVAMQRSCSECQCRLLITMESFFCSYLQLGLQPGTTSASKPKKVEKSSFSGFSSLQLSSFLVFVSPILFLELH